MSLRSRPALFVATMGCVAAGLALVALVAAAGLSACSSFRTSGAGAEEEAGGGDDAAAPSPFQVVNGLPEGEAFNAIWGADAETLFVVGTNGVHDDYYDGSWHRTQSVSGRNYFALWGRSATEVYAVGTIEAGGRGVVQRFDGTTWRDEYVAPTALYGIWGAGNVVYAVGAQGWIYGKMVGTTSWAARLSKGLPANPNVASTPDSPVLWSISGNGSEDFAMAADLDRVFHYEGNGNFVNLDPSVDRTVSFRSAWAAPGGSTSVFFGTNYLGVTWLAAPSVAPGLVEAGALDDMVRLHEEQTAGADALFIQGIWGAGSKVVFVGDQGTIFVYDSGSNAFGRVASPTSDASLRGVWASAPDDVWIVGQREIILHGALPD